MTINDCFKKFGKIPYCINMESKKTINLPEKTFDNKDLPKKKVYKKKNNKEIKIEKPILSFSFNHGSIV